jgi:pimeloyl-ACP methyl ester carboxylesterase/membrane protein DedA with SNARE-associated domain
MRRFLKIFAGYALVLLASHLFQYFFQRHKTLSPGQKQLELTTSAGPVSIAYFDTGTSDHDKRPVLLLLHGSPVGAELFTPLSGLLEKKFRVIAPSFPGFEASTRKIPDYSIRAHARYIDDFLRQLGLTSVHVVGYSMGSGVALELHHRVPDLFASLTLLSGIGAQEYELLGNYHLNHLLHGLQLGLIWCVDKFVPHFGRLENFPLNYYYARNFYDTDQRPLATYMAEIAIPALILHGEADMLVPVAAARMHHKLITGSRLLVFPREGHLLLSQKPGLVATALSDFIKRVEAGGALPAVRHDAPAQGKIRPARARGGALWFLCILIALATLVSEDIAAVGSGILAANGNISPAQAVMAAFAGIFIGDILLLLLGRFFRKRSFVKCFVSEEAAAGAAAWLERRGAYAIFLSRFIPGTRLPLYFAAGFAGRQTGKFIAVFCLACLVWTPLIVGAGFFLGEGALEYLARYNGSAFLIVFAVFALFFFVRKILIPLATWKGRRLLYSTYLRVTHWEFWPPWIFYIPLGFYFTYLIVRYRSFTVFTAANPAIPAGGVIGESKAAILQGLSGARKNIARFALLETASVSERMQNLTDFMRREKLKFPIVLKPDVGERGNGVAIVKSENEAFEYFSRNLHAIILQEFIPGLEFGVFYFRYPESVTGNIFAITDKRFTALTGDGKSTLEELVLSDSRALMMARFHLHKFAVRLGEVIPAGEKFPLVELGTHCKGALFLDGKQFSTPELERAIDKISLKYDGFYFGRYDLRVPSIEDFKNGKNLKIVELNGVTSEATSIYDPRNSLWSAYQVLARQWRIAFEIGAQNRFRGYPTTTVVTLLRHIAAI